MRLFKNSIIGIIILFSILSLPKNVSAAWMDAKWLYRAAVPITAHTAAETNVYTTITIDTATPIAAGKMQADCGDIRVAKFNGAALPYFINASPGCNNVATTIQVYFTSFPAGAQIIYYYYGNPTTYNGFKNSAFSTAATGETIGTVGSEEQSAYPVGFWKFDDGQGQSTKDGSSQGNNGTLGATSGSSTDDPTWITEDRCVSGKCLKFDGVGTYVNVGDPANGSLDFGTSSFSISAWVRTGSSSNQTIVSKRNSATGSTGYRFRISSTGALLLTVTDESANQVDPNTSGYNLIDNKWHYVEVVANRTTNIATFYVDGKPVVASASDLSSVTGSISNNIGLRVGFTPDSAQPFDGFLDNVKIYNYARSAAQIKADYNAGKANATAHSGSSVVMGAKTQDYLSSGLVGYWKMDDNVSGDAKSLVDASGNSNTLTTYYGSNATGMDCTAAGKYGGGCSFDGTDDYVTKASTNISTLPITLSVWAKATNINQSSGHILQAFDNQLYIDVTSGNFRFTKNGVGSITYAGSSGTWYHLVGIMDSGYNMSFYVNGSLVGTRAGGDPGSSSAVYLGAYSSAANFFGGSIDEARIYNRILSAKEVSDLYNWAPGPVGYWNMDDKIKGASKTIVDTSSNANNGTTYGTGIDCSKAPGKYGGACTFNGTDDYVDLGNQTIYKPGSGSFTVMAWVKSTVNQAKRIVTMRDAATPRTAYDIYSTSDVYRFDVADGTNAITPAESGISASDGKWHHITGVIDRSSNLAILYVDGVKQDSGSISGFGAISPDASLIIGNFSTSWWSGQIDDVKIYNYARSAKQVVEDMNAGHPAVGTPVGSAVGHWKFDEGQGTTANNSGSAGSTLNGSISGASWSQSGKFGRALSFDGNNDDINASSNTAVDNLLNNDTTFSVWINPDACNGIRDVLGKNGGAARGWYFLGSTSNCDPKLIVYYDSGVNSAAYQASTGSVATGTWQQLTAVWTASTKSAKIYVNGKEVSYATQTAGTGTYDADASYNLAIGNYSPGAVDTRLFDGLMDEVKIYNYALTADEVKTDYNKGQSAQLSATGNNTTYAAGAANQEYCVPGDTTSCAAPVGRWDFEEGTGGSVNDTSGNANTGTWNGTGPHWTSGKIGKAGKFNGTDDMVSVGNASSLNFGGGAFSVEAWIKANSIAIFPIVFKGNLQDRNIWLGTVGSKITGGFEQETTGSNIIATGATTLSNNTWYHVAVTYDGTDTILVYVNGAQDGSLTDSTDPAVNADSLVIGEDAPNGDIYANGQIDQVRVFNYARSAAQVAYDYNRGGPVGWWKFDECQGTIAHDSAGTNNGTITIGASGEDTLGTCTTSSTAWGSGATGKRNASLSFDGTDDLVNIGSSVSLPSSQPFTVSAWINRTSGSGNFPVGWYQGTNGFLMYDNGTARVATGGVNYTTTTTTLNTTGSWNHIVMVFDGTNLKTYHNGVAKDSIPASYAKETVGVLHIGNLDYSSGQTGYFNGQIDDVRIFNYALTATQVKDLYTNGSATFAPSTGTP